MNVDVLLGLQWGDEGKGKIIDILAPEYDIIARFQGGPNAGHTLEFENQKHVLHQYPSGVFREKAKNLVGDGMVVNIITFHDETKYLAQFIPLPELISRIVISRGAQLILPTHRMVDRAQEAAKQEGKIGTTQQGIGPCYEDKIARRGLRIGWIFKEDFKARYRKLKQEHLEKIISLKQEIDYSGLSIEEEKFFAAVEFIKRFRFVDGPIWLDEQLKNLTALAEGAQGTFLDICYGSPPFTTSSNTISAGVCTGLGIPPNRVGDIYGLFKAYSTRVGNGPFPTELGGKQSEKWCAESNRQIEENQYPNASMDDIDDFRKGIALRTLGFEYGATTGRLRRTGWLDLVALKFAIMINGVKYLIMSKADVMNGFKEVKICTQYQLKDGSKVDICSPDNMEEVMPIYTTLKGWSSCVTSTGGIDENFQAYIDFIEKGTGKKIMMIGTGPKRSQIIRPA